MPTRAHANASSAAEALQADATAACARALARATGTHALLLDATRAATPSLPGVAHWTSLQPASRGSGWQGQLRAGADALPFGDDSFCAVLVRFCAGAGVVPETVADELSRVLAPHGVLLVVERHPGSLWRGVAMAPARWERALRQADLDVVPALRCGAPWPRVRGIQGLPRWLVRGFGGAYVVAARQRTQAAIPLRRAAAKRRVKEHTAALPGARSQCA